MNTTNPNGNRHDFDLSKLQEQVADVCGLEMANVKWDETPAAETLISDFREKGIDDVLGLYYPEDFFITIYVERCRQFARETKLQPDDVILIVLIHELAHRVHHLGIAKQAPWIWRNFPSAPEKLAKQRTPADQRKVVEQLAEQTTLIMVKASYPRLQKAFDEMQELAPTIYWLDPKTREECHRTVAKLSPGTPSSKTEFAEKLAEESDRHVPDREDVVTGGVDE